MVHSDTLRGAVFVSRFNRVLAIVIWVLALVLLLVTLVAGGPNRPLAIVPAAFVGLFAWTVLWRPYLRVDDTGVRVRNVLESVDIPWAALIHVDTRFALSLHTPRRQFSVWAAPAPGRTGTAMARRAERHGRVDAAPSVDGRVRPGDLVGSESGQAAYLVRDRWKQLLDSGAIESGIADTTPVRVRWHWFIDLSLVLLGITAIVSLARP